MYVAPRVQIDDDPLFPVRVALMPIIGLLAAMWLRSPMPMLYPVLFFSLSAGNRKALDMRRVIAAPIIFSLALWVMSGLVVMLQGVPLVLVATMGLVYILAFYMIYRTGNSFGMLIAVAAVLMSVMGLGSYQAMFYLRGEMTKAAMCTAIFIPLLYWLLPPKTTEKMVDVYVPVFSDQLMRRAVIRGLTLLAFSLYLYTFLDFSNMILGVAAMFVLVFPARRSVWAEAGQRTFSVLLGGSLGMVIVTLLNISSHLIVLMAAIFLVVMWLATKMIHGRLPSMAYQDAASVMLSLVGGALATSEPSFAFMQRAGLTIVGTIVAAFAVSLLETLFLKPTPAPAALPAGAEA